MNIQERLFELRDSEYAEFQGKLIPNIEKENIIGVRVPVLRKLAKEYAKDEESAYFLDSLPHKYYDENMLQGLMISEMKNYDECIAKTNQFLPNVDNWAVCDIMSPKIFAKNKDLLLIQVKRWIKSKDTYTCRFGLGMLMRHFLDDDFKPEYLMLASGVKSEEYYVKMMVAWFFATALAKQWESAIIYLENGSLDRWTNNKTITKACESYRITHEQKIYLKTFRK